MSAILTIFQYMGMIVLYPMCYILQMMGFNSDSVKALKENSVTQWVVGLGSIITIVFICWVYPMLFSKKAKKRRYTKKSSRRKRRK